MGEKTTTSNRSRIWSLALIVLVGTVYFFGLGFPFVGPDEPRYAEVAREMLLRGDWITPTLGGFNWFEKPALLYWLEICSFKLFGVSEFSARMGPAMFGVGTVVCLWIFGSKLKGPAAGRLLALMSAATLGILVFSRGASFDIIVTFPITASVVCFYFAQDDEAPSASGYLLLIGAYFFIGVALLAKGLIGIIFPFAIATLFLILARRSPNRRILGSLLWGPFVALIVAGIWYVPMFLRYGAQFFNEFIVQHHFERFTSNKYQHPQPFYFFLWVLPLMALPWTPFFVIQLWKLARSFFRRRTAVDMPRRLAPAAAVSFAWVVVPLGFFSLSGSKLPGYILPAVPGAVCLAWIAINELIERKPVWSRLAAGTAIATLLITAILAVTAVPKFAEADSVRSLIARADADGYGGCSVVSLRTLSNNAEFYAAGRLLRNADGSQPRFSANAEIISVLRHQNGSPILVLVPLRSLSDLTQAEGLKTSVLGDNKDLAIVLVSLSDIKPPPLV